ncbi:nucleoside-diphosphate-sugar epimerase [Sinobacterium caligoides]|uniref:Nucleoside-diphosphate-sugar epimerase n=1 Tax=Sinobacterium caligoides TaxID=933926 RepID=A0A3N2DH57_9GAMM|nr:SDR family oxidoreductase [Sinobacterium caligoides]ROR99089.1 nucleoside-diphosphate-sugar epimerase [Sinobacterium caligoides]
MARILIVGCGRLGIMVGDQLLRQGHEVTGLRRHPEQLPQGFFAVAADITDPASLAGLARQCFDYVLVATTAGEFNDQAYRRVYVEGLGHLLAALSKPIKRLFLVSSTSVYHQSAGEWVDEASVTQPSSFSGVRQLEAEALAQESSIPVTVIRFSGIYGPGRYRLIEQVLHGQGASGELYTNRIHIDDCSAVICHLLALSERGDEGDDQLYVATDHLPVTMLTIKQWLAVQLGVEGGTLSAASVANRRSSKKLSNSKLLATGYRFLYPSYLEGYSQVLEGWRQQHRL